MTAERASAFTGAPAVSIQDLTVRRGGKAILPGISLHVRAGAVTGLLGPSGSGKTTLIRAIAGVQIVQSGAVTVLGLPAGHPELRRRVAYVTQSPSIYPDLTVLENLNFFARVVGAPSSRIGTVVESVGLSAQARQVVGTLSGGERSRASLAAALLGEPELLVLDEPTVGLDPGLRLELWRMFHELAAEGASLLISTHVMDEATRCDDLLMMREGRVVGAAPPATLLAQTHTTTVEDAFLALARGDVAAGEGS